MGSYVVRRLLFGLFIVWGVYTLTFLAVNLAPGDPFANLENPRMTKEDIDRLKAKWGYDKPLLVAYFHQLRKMFWAEDEVLHAEAGGLAFEVFAGPRKNEIRARVQEPPPEIVLRPRPESLAEGAVEVRLPRRPDGSYEERPVRKGEYLVDPHRFTVGEGESVLVTQGFRLRAADGVVTAEPALARAPDEVVLEETAAGRLVLPARGGGAYGPVEADPGRYAFGGGEVLVPPERLATAGPTFDLGESVFQRKPVWDILGPALLNTLILASGAMLVEFLVGILIGVVSATRPNSKTDHALTLGALFVYSMPGFWLALMLMLLFAVKLRWLPGEGMHSAGESGFLDLLQHMVLPVFVLGIAAAAETARYQRSAMLEVFGQDYIRTARAKGLPERTVIWKHAMRNSLLPVITIFGLYLPFLVSGAVIVETIFSWPGIGRQMIGALSQRDVFVITGVTLVATTAVVIGSLLADVLYALADPRVRLT